MKIDARGLSCPEPVLLTQRAIHDGETEIETQVDMNISKENVKRCMENAGYSVEVVEEGDEYTVKGKK